MKPPNPPLANALMSFLLVAVSAAPAPGGHPAQTSRTSKAKKVWTNEDVERLRGKAGVSVVGSAPSAAAADAGKPRVPAQRYAREKDAEWYRERLAPLRSEIEEVSQQIRELSEYRSISRWMVGGLIFPQANIPQNPEEQIKQLETRRRELLRQVGELEDLARRNDISPGAIR